MELTKEQKIDKIASNFKEIMLTLGLDLNDPELKDTPLRVGKMYTNEIFSGLDKENEPKMTVFPNKIGYNQIVALTNIKSFSTCQHHFLPYSVNISIAYIPDVNYVGISKLARTVEFFSATPSTQEILVHKIANYIEEKLKPLGLMIYASGKHSCAGMRGIKKPDSVMITSEVRGLFRTNLELETKFLNMIEKDK